MSKIIFDGKKVGMFVSAVVAAAGSSSRMGEDKLFMLLDGVPVLARSIAALEKCEYIDEIIVVTRADLITRVNALVKQYDFTKVSCVCEGGETRAQSVRKAVENCSDKAGLFVIHDGARPFVKEETVKRTVEAAFKFGAAACAVRVKDTIKLVDKDGFVTDTPDRNTLRAVQTPQVFRNYIYKDALEKADDSVTDDCMTVEAAGYKVKLVEGDYTNIKLTTPDDILSAQAILKGRGE
jgi:2-C-methyl-D-erythritol 4-phosphate cytidylyltransferase